MRIADTYRGIPFHWLLHCNGYSIAVATPFQWLLHSSSYSIPVATPSSSSQNCSHGDIYRTRFRVGAKSYKNCPFGIKVKICRLLGFYLRITQSLQQNTMKTNELGITSSFLMEQNYATRFRPEQSKVYFTYRKMWNNSVSKDLKLAFLASAKAEDRSKFQRNSYSWFCFACKFYREVKQTQQQFSLSFYWHKFNSTTHTAPLSW